MLKRVVLQSALLILLALPVWGQYSDGAGAISSPVTTDPLSLTGVVTFNNAANTPVTCSDGLIDSTLTAGRVTFAGASGRLSDDADLTFATDTLSATKAVGSTSVCGGGASDAANSVCVTGNTVTGEGATADANEMVLAFGDSTADHTLTLTGVTSPAAGIKVNGTGLGIFFYPGGSASTSMSLFSTGVHVDNGLQLFLGNSSTDTPVGLKYSASSVALVTNGTTGVGALLHAVGVETVSTTKAPAVTESSELYTNGADVDGQTVTLPNDPTVGVCYEFALTSTDTSNSFAIAPSAGETLQDGASACATSFSATAKGATARICAVSGGAGALWLVMSKNGTWTCS